MPIEEAADFFAAIPAIARHLVTLKEVGLGYVRLGQPAPTLSGGEAQRVKLASELQKRSTGRTLYVLDEPTTGLHFEDIRKLLGVLGRLVDAGNTVVVIEHNLDVIKTADWLIDMGPEGGSRGGTLVAEGTPEQIAATPESYTGEFLKPILEGREVPVGLVQEAFASRVAAPITKAAVKRAAQAERAAATKRLPGEVPTNGRAAAKKAATKKPAAKSPAAKAAEPAGARKAS
jgi:excinuclease ABC subunit A